MKKGQGWAKRVTLENLSSFAAYLRRAEDDEARRKKFAEERKEKIAKVHAPSPFQGEALNFPNRFTQTPRAAGTRKKRQKQVSAQPASPGGAAAIAGKNPLLWRKTFNRSDAQQTSAGTNPTGCLRFTQAPRDNAKAIDQTTFFRNQVFGKFKWVEIKKQPYEEATTVPFQITINGKLLGIFELQIRHKPSGEAGQGNYTTSLHWGRKLVATIRESVSPGQVFALYSPTQGSESPFIVEIS